MTVGIALGLGQARHQEPILDCEVFGMYDGQTRNNPSGTKAGFANGWMGKTGEIRVPLREDLLVEVGEVTLAADSTFCVLPSTVTLEHRNTPSTKHCNTVC
jgi:hypothetical protein